MEKTQCVSLTAVLKLAVPYMHMAVGGGENLPSLPQISVPMA